MSETSKQRSTQRESETAQGIHKQAGRDGETEEGRSETHVSSWYEECQTSFGKGDLQDEDWDRDSVVASSFGTYACAIFATILGPPVPGSSSGSESRNA
ncbi:hypothetical protein TrCOL_g12503 [Triparma columacea]|uniref:Uncharacterized protein n=1 Tax=Triparma columacea TaxID=722753 RepID=A0A9W7LGK0_9STRA|nr:hypothetical protein TrCOL_g12503 [Triparma columacea]